MCAATLRGILDAEAAAQRAAAVAAVAATEGAEALASLRGLDRAAVHAVIAAAFKAADADGSGTLDANQVETVLRSLVEDDSGVSIQIPSKAVTAMMSALDTDGDGAVQYNEMVDFFVDVLLHVERQAAVGTSLEAAKARAAGADAAAAAAQADARAAAAAQAAASAAAAAALVEADVAGALAAITVGGLYALAESSC